MYENTQKMLSNQREFHNLLSQGEGDALLMFLFNITLEGIVKRAGIDTPAYQFQKYRFNAIIPIQPHHENVVAQSTTNLHRFLHMRMTLTLLVGVPDMLKKYI